MKAHCPSRWCCCMLHTLGWPLQVIMATNRADTLDPALLRPGRLDRKIEFPLPDRRQKRLVFQARSCRTSTLNVHCNCMAAFEGALARCQFCVPW